MEEARKLARELGIDKLIDTEIGKVIKKVKKLIELQEKGHAEEAFRLKEDIGKEITGIIFAIAPGGVVTPEMVAEQQVIDLMGRIVAKVEKLIAMQKPPPPASPSTTTSLYLCG